MCNHVAPAQGEDIHDHVRRCPQNPNPGNVFVDEPTYARFLKEKRRVALHAYMGTLSEEVRAVVLRNSEVMLHVRELGVRVV